MDIAKLPAGGAWTFVAWLAAQLVTLLLCVVAGEPIGLNPAWSGQWLLILQFLMGLAFCGIYIRTGNLFLAIGLHALANNPGPLLTGAEFLVPPTLFSWAKTYYSGAWCLCQRNAGRAQSVDR